MGALAIATGVVLASAVNNNGTFTVSYPAGSTQTTLQGSTNGRMVVNGDAVFAQGASGFTAVFGSSNITVTNTTGATLAAGAVIDISFGDTSLRGNFEGTIRVCGVTALTASTGTASDTIADVTATPTQTLVNNNFASVSAKINELRAALVTAGILNG